MDQYFVECHAGGWRVRFEGSHIGIFPSKAAAMAWAIEKAHNALARSIEARVLAQDDTGQFSVAWTNTIGRWSSAA